MQISQLKKLLRPIKELTSRRGKRPSAETLESKGENKMQNSECIMQNLGPRSCIQHYAFCISGPCFFSDCVYNKSKE